ncbi:MAG: MalY/PatB family protein [Lachnospiraceae bacterium]
MDFDRIVDRRNTNSLKYDFATERKQRDDLLPLWVADMDFQLPEEILNELHRAVSHGIFGYSDAKEDYYLALSKWFLDHFSWEPKREWVVRTPGVVFAIATAIRAFTEPGDSVLIEQPVYYPFANCIIKSGRHLVVSELLYENGTYSMNFDDLEKKIVSEKVRLILLCSPHNPVGRVWTKEELLRFSDLCEKYGILVVSDEIHCDFTYPGHPHTIYASLSETAAEHCIVCTAPSKTFNMAGLQISNIFIPNETLRTAFCKELELTGYCESGLLALVGCQAAYTYGDAWLTELKQYLLGNLNYVREFLRTRLPELHLVEPEGTYLIWLDCSGLHLSPEELETLIVDKAKLWLDAGSMFGAHSSQFERINIACPRATLKQALEQLATACRQR